MSKSKRIDAAVDHKRMRQVERDVATLQIELEAMGERLDMVEAENRALRAMWGGTTHSGVPYWAVRSTHTGHFVQPTSMTVSEGGEWR